jgi:hypothetical protein
MDHADILPAPGGAGASLAAGAAAVAEPAPLVAAARGWTRWLSLGISAAILVAVALSLQHLNLREAETLFPRTLSFWLVFIAYYFALPVGDWIIYRRLWQIPSGGFLALLRKQVCNELLFGYSGEVYFYTWARRNARLTGAPFGAVKDVAILSAVAGNAVTLAMVLLVWPLLPDLALSGPSFNYSVLAVAAMSFLIVIFQRQLLSLPKRELVFVFGLHMLRICVATLLGILLWHLALPGVAIGMWALLAAFRLLVSRLPLMPNKDVVFAGFAIFLVGRGGEVTAVVAMVATLLFVTNLICGSLLVAGDLADGEALR